MRRSVLPALLLLLALPGVAGALGGAQADGTLSVRNGDGVVSLDLRGVVIGRIASGKLTVFGPKEGSCDAPLVWGAEDERLQAARDRITGLSRLRCVYSGTAIRFRLVGGQNELRATGEGISISAVGSGFVELKGKGGADGTYSRNGAEYLSLPDRGASFELTGSPAP